MTERESLLNAILGEVEKYIGLVRSAAAISPICHVYLSCLSAFSPSQTSQYPKRGA
jgi:hypothetical protein